jgi:enoyl-CoA hydratase/carnithine racemase
MHGCPKKPRGFIPGGVSLGKNFRQGRGFLLAGGIYFNQFEGNRFIWTATISNLEKRNTLTPKMLEELSDFLRAQKHHEDIRVLVVRGAGEKSFSAGYDISKIQSGAGAEDEEKTSSEVLYRALKDIENFPAPVIAMINGYCLGAGCHLAATADLRISSEEAKYGITPAKLGLVYHPEGIYQLFSLIGPAKTKELFYTGSLYSAKEAKEMGLVDYIIPANKLEETVYDLARKIADNAPLSVRGTKYIVNNIVHAVHLNSEVMQNIENIRQKAYASEDLKEGKRAFSEKRKPIFKGR